MMTLNCLVASQRIVWVRRKMAIVYPRIHGHLPLDWLRLKWEIIRKRKNINLLISLIIALLIYNIFLFTEFTHLSHFSIYNINLLTCLFIYLFIWRTIDRTATNVCLRSIGSSEGSRNSPTSSMRTGKPIRIAFSSVRRNIPSDNLIIFRPDDSSFWRIQRFACIDRWIIFRL